LVYTDEKNLTSILQKYTKLLLTKCLKQTQKDFGSV
jgi:hypothetical protein